MNSPAAVNAVQCAVDLQKDMAAANRDLLGDLQVVLRIGVNLGDVIVEGSDLYGDGVNIAARLEAIAEPGGILVSGTAHDHVVNKIKVTFEDLGTQTLKNIAAAVRAYSVTGELAIAAGATKSASEKSALAVLPFVNLSGDPEQQYFSDGITEDIITELSRFRDLFVIARNSSFQFRDKSVDIKHIGKSLGVEYVVEGSVRKSSSRMRVTAQLIAVATGAHLWAEHYDRDLEDIFAIQDEVTQTIVATLVGRLTASGAEKARRKPTQHWVAYDFFLQGRDRASVYDVDTAEPLLRRAIELDPNFAQPYTFLAFMYLWRYFSDGRIEQLNEALIQAKKAVSLDENDARCRATLGSVCVFMHRLDLAGIHLSKAIALNPSDATVAVTHAHWLARMGRTSEALEKMDIAVQRDPFPPEWYWEARAVPLLQEKRYEEMIQAYDHFTELQVWHVPYLAVCYAQLGRIEEAKAQAVELLRRKPDFSMKWIIAMEPYKNPADLEHLVEGLRKAGLPE
ncbi:MAG: adenylate/guanylate cyclase domain-containing protein [Blastocatellia bacterium]